ncbi:MULTISPECIES: hypothetical protein [unclassified Bradyrhizobium]|uniref:hypothetical protein n=1 Tax=unclassified Bradyrhizobium TaxID=2631580 RepID=UPI003394B8DF
MSRKIQETGAIPKKGVRVALSLDHEQHEQLRLIAYSERATIQKLLTEGFELMVAKRATSEKLSKPARSTRRAEAVPA